MLSSGLGAAPALGGTGADKITLDVRQPAENGNHQAPASSARCRCRPTARQWPKLRLRARDVLEMPNRSKVLRASRSSVRIGACRRTRKLRELSNKIPKVSTAWIKTLKVPSISAEWAASCQFNHPPRGLAAISVPRGLLPSGVSISALLVYCLSWCSRLSAGLYGIIRKRQTNWW